MVDRVYTDNYNRSADEPEESLDALIADMNAVNQIPLNTWYQALFNFIGWFISRLVRFIR
jgi:hypothetical protein